MPKKGTPRAAGTGTKRGQAAKGMATESKPSGGMEAGAATATVTAKATPTHDQIAQRARQIWERRGYPQGQDREIWLEAETQLAKEMGGK